MAVVKIGYILLIWLSVKIPGRWQDTHVARMAVHRLVAGQILAGGTPFYPDGRCPENAQGAPVGEGHLRWTVDGRAVSGNPGAYVPADGDVILVSFNPDGTTPAVPEGLQQLLARYNKLFPGSAQFTAGSACSGLYRGMKLWEAAVKEAGTLDQAAVIKALDHAKIAQGPGGPAEMVPGQHHVRMHMYIGQATGGRFTIVKNLGAIDPKEANVPIS